MKGTNCVCTTIATILILLVFLSVFIHARHINSQYESNHPVTSPVSRKKAVTESEMKSELIRRGIGQKRGADTLEIAGSSLPDCSHACGSCRPCRLVMVSFVCSSIEEAETCPMAYKCMCHNKSYPVP